MTAAPLVSVIIPAFNAAAYIDATLASVRAQTHRHLEIIVVDDGSTDDTARIVEQHAAADTRVRLIRQSNAGVGAARNAAAAVATGAYLAPIDADDIWLPAKIEKQVACLEREGPGTGLCYTWWIGIDHDGATLSHSHPWRIAGRIADAHIAMNFLGNASVPMFRRDCFEAVGGYATTFHAAKAQGCEDWDLSLRLAEITRVAVVPEYLTGYRRVDGAMSSSLDAMARSHGMLIDRLAARRPDAPAALVRWSRGQLYAYLAAFAARRGNPGAAARWIGKGLLSADVSFRSPWITELALATLPRWIGGIALPAVQRRATRWVE